MIPSLHKGEGLNVYFIAEHWPGKCGALSSVFSTIKDLDNKNKCFAI